MIKLLITAALLTSCGSDDIAFKAAGPKPKIVQECSTVNDDLLASINKDDNLNDLSSEINDIFDSVDPSYFTRKGDTIANYAIREYNSDTTSWCYRYTFNVKENGKIILAESEE